MSKKAAPAKEPLISAPTQTEESAAPVDEEQVRLRAWEIWQSEGCPEGKSNEHWVRALRELTGEAHAQ